MKRRAILGILLLGGLAILFFRDRTPDPVWNGRKASAWAADLDGPTPTMRAQAWAALTNIGPAAGPALGKFLRRGRSPFPAFVSSALEKAHLGETIAPLNPETLQAALELLSQMGAAAAPATGDIIKLLDHPSQNVVLDAEHALRAIGPAAVAPIVQHLRNGPAGIRARAAKILSDFAVAEPSVAALATALGDASPRVRAAAAESLGKLGALTATDGLRKALQDSSPEVRARACGALGLLGAKAAIPEITKRLRDPATMVQLESAKALWKLQRDANPVLPALEKLLTSAESWQAAYALAELHEEAAPAVPALIEAMRREQVSRPFRASSSATYALSQIGAPAIPRLIEELRDPSPAQRVNAALALGYMEKTGTPALPALLQATADSERDVRQALALALGSIGSDDPRAIAALAECLHAEDIVMRSRALAYIRKLAPNTEWAAGSE